MENKHFESSNNGEFLKRVSFAGKIKLKIRRLKKSINNLYTKFKETDKKELFTDIFSSRYFILFIFAIIFIKTIIFLGNTVFYKNGGIWPWHLRQTAFFIIIMVAPMLLFRNSRWRFSYGIILNILISCLLFADELYYEYASNIISVMQARKSSILKRNFCCNSIIAKI